MDIANRQVKKVRQSGAATTEFAVSLLFFVPIFVMLPIIGKYISFKHKNIESNRYAVWERTVWSDPSGSWNDNENVKNNTALSGELDRRFYGNQRQGMASTVTSNSNLWVDASQQQLLTKDQDESYRVRVNSSNTLSPVDNDFADIYAFKGIPGIGGALTNATSVFTSSVGSFISNCENIPGVDYEKGMNLGSRNYALISVSSVLRNKTLADPDDKDEDEQMRFTSQGSILSNAWTAPTESLFKQRVDNLVINEVVSCIASPSILLSAFPVYKEGKSGSKVAGSGESAILLQDYLP